MRTVSFQGAQLSAGQRLRLQQQAHVRSFMHPVLQAQVDEALKELEARKEQGVKPEKLWQLDYEVHGTVCIAEWMGF